MINTGVCLEVIGIVATPLHQESMTKVSFE